MGDLRGRLIAFDLDGTLIDSRRDLADSANLLIRERGGYPLPEEAIGRMVGEGARVLVERALTAAGVPTGDGALERFLEIYDGRLLRHTVAYQGIPEILAAAHDVARLVVLTNKPTHHSERILDGLGLRRWFDEVVGGDGPWARKPDPASLLALMAAAETAPARTLVVGDSFVDFETARRAHVRCCLATYGYGFDTFPREQLTGAEWIADTPGALAGLLTTFRAE